MAIYPKIGPGGSGRPLRGSSLGDQISIEFSSKEREQGDCDSG